MKTNSQSVWAILLLLAIALTVQPLTAVAGCPEGYEPCGSQNQLCCPI
jgi:hypothetical protein